MSRVQEKSGNHGPVLNHRSHQTALFRSLCSDYWMPMALTRYCEMYCVYKPGHFDKRTSHREFTSISACVSVSLFAQIPAWIIRWSLSVCKWKPAIRVYASVCVCVCVWQMWVAVCLLSERRWGISRPFSKPPALPLGSDLAVVYTIRLLATRWRHQ